MTLHERIAEALGWSVEETRSYSLQALRELVWLPSPKLAYEITHQIALGSVLTERRERRL